MIITTSFIPHEYIAEYCGVVSGTVVSGIGFGKDWIASIKDITGGRIGGYEKSIEGVRDKAVSIMEQEAQRKGADAIIMVRMSFEVFSPSEKGTVVGGIVYGTAVKLKKRYDIKKDDIIRDNMIKDDTIKNNMIKDDTIKGNIIKDILEIEENTITPDQGYEPEHESDEQRRDVKSVPDTFGVGFDWKK